MNNKQLNELNTMRWMLELISQEKMTPKQLVMDYNVEVLSTVYYSLDGSEWLELV